ncbi:MAG: hypothetical protein ACI9UD_001664 [Glaciecola sp.]
MLIFLDYYYSSNDRLFGFRSLLVEFALCPVARRLAQLYQSGLIFIEGSEKSETKTAPTCYQDDITFLGFEVII